MADITNWTTDTSIDGATGRVLVMITVVDGGGQRFQQEWLSDAPAPVSVSASSPPSVRLEHAAVSNEMAIAGPLLARTVVAQAIAPSKVRISVPRRG